jgi:hypothetical protein
MYLRILKSINNLCIKKSGAFTSTDLIWDILNHNIMVKIIKIKNIN